ncbi:hypothetical protein J5751_04830 [bacterium]|nr:hypothetical protein [bacterium]
MGAVAGAAMAIGAIASTAGTIYSINSAKKQQKKVDRAEREAKEEAQRKIDERNAKIKGMKTRLYEAEEDKMFTNDEDKQVKGV